jgi:hypothetical protein
MPTLSLGPLRCVLAEPWEIADVSGGASIIAALRPDSIPHGFLTNIVLQKVADADASLMQLVAANAERMPAWRVVDYVQISPVRERLVAAWLGEVPVTVFQELHRVGSAAATATYSCAVTWLGCDLDDSEAVLATLITEGGTQ